LTDRQSRTPSAASATAWPAAESSPISTCSAAPRWLAYDSRRATRDIDAIFKPHGIVLDEARAVAAELDLPNWWLNEQATAYVAPGGDPSAPRVFDHRGLRVSVASPRHLLAMKVLAARPQDIEDVHLLVQHLNLTSAEDIVALTAEIFPDDPVPDRVRLLLEDLLKREDDET
jgi:hypothetical protein